MPSQEPSKLSKEQKERLKDPRFIIAARAVKPQRDRKLREPTR